MSGRKDKKKHEKKKKDKKRRKSSSSKAKSPIKKEDSEDDDNIHNTEEVEEPEAIKKQRKREKHLKSKQKEKEKKKKRKKKKQKSEDSDSESDSSSDSSSSSDSDSDNEPSRKKSRKRKSISSGSTDTKEKTNQNPQHENPKSKVHHHHKTKKLQSPSHTPTTSPTPDPISSTSSAPLPPSSPQGLFKHQTLVVEAALHPSDLKDVNGAITRTLHKNFLLRFIASCGGVLISYGEATPKPTVMPDGGTQVLGCLRTCDPHVHLEIQVKDGLVFQPQCGMKLTGVVNEAFPSHCGMLVYGFFNAMVPASVLVAQGFVYDRYRMRWARARNTNTDQFEEEAIAVHSRIQFVVSDVHECVGVLSMDGTDPVVLGDV